ncbi:MAG TPA: iron ABC transporter permease [Acidimicrobiales bacterium]|nr:iron ABC transporter permease [Acidimicrobiales bacterium]
MDLQAPHGEVALGEAPPAEAPLAVSAGQAGPETPPPARAVQTGTEAPPPARAPTEPAGGGGAPPRRRRLGWQLAGTAVVLAGAACAGMLIGPAGLPPGGVLLALADKLPFVSARSGLGSVGDAIVYQIRAPRVVLGGIVGAMLAMAGSAYQGVFQNPLADPYLLGVAAGAGLGATLVIVLAPTAAASAFGPLPLAAFGGAIVAVAATYALGRSAGRLRSSASLVLAGVAVASFFTAIQTFLQQRSSSTLNTVYDWILGGLATASWQQVELVLPYVAVSATVLVCSRRLLDVMSVGDEEADSLGVRASRVRLAAVAAATLGTAAVVSVSGLIGFVGIIVPHTVRLVVGPSYRSILPLSALAGASFLILADLAARSLLSPAEVPLGVVTAVLGAPFFLVVLRQSRRLA